MVIIDSLKRLPNELSNIYMRQRVQEIFLPLQTNKTFTLSMVFSMKPPPTSGPVNTRYSFSYCSGVSLMNTLSKTLAVSMG